MRRLLFVALVLVSLVTLSPAIVVAQATPSPVALKTGDGKSRTAPLAFGKPVHIGDYKVRVVDVTPDALDAIMAANPYNKPPAAGHQFFMVRVEATYTGSASGTVWVDLQFSAVGKSNTGYGVLNTDCGDIPDAATSVGEMFTGGVAQFNVCWSIASSDADSLEMYVDVGFSRDSRRWFSLQKPAH